MALSVVLLAFLVVAWSGCSTSAFSIEGKVTVTGIKVSSYATETRILVQGPNGKITVGFLQTDGKFIVSGLPAGLYLVEVASSNYLFDHARVDISSSGKPKAKKDNPVQPSAGAHMHYPLKFVAKGPVQFFTPRETWSLRDVLMQPMVLFMVLPILLMLCLPKMMESMDPDAKRQMQEEGPSLFNQSQDVKYELTDFFQYVFPERKGKKPAAIKKAAPSTRKR